MKTKAVRIYGKNDLRLEEFDLPKCGDDEILAHVISNSICMSSHKAALQGADHKRVHDDVAEHPAIIGHEFCGEIVEVGSKWADQFKVGDRFTIQPAMNYNNTLWAPGYSYEYCGGNATYVIIPNEVMECNCLLPYKGDAFFYGSLSEPVSCIIGGYHANYHTTNGSYVHDMGIVEGGKVAILAGVGPMGLGAINYAIGADRKPSLVVVTDIDKARIDRAKEILSVEMAAEKGVKLIYVNTSEYENPVEYLMSLTDGHGYDDVFVYAPVKPVVEQGDKILACDGCLNFFAVHYASTHIVGTSGGNTDDMRESIKMMEEGTMNPAAMITHVGGLNVAADTIIDLDKIPGGKKLIYTNKEMPLVAIADFAEMGKTDKFYADLHEICARHNMLWNAEAEKYVLDNAKEI